MPTYDYLQTQLKVTSKIGVHFKSIYRSLSVSFVVKSLKSKVKMKLLFGILIVCSFLGVFAESDHEVKKTRDGKGG